LYKYTSPAHNYANVFSRLHIFTGDFWKTLSKKSAKIRSAKRLCSKRTVILSAAGHALGGLRSRRICGSDGLKSNRRFFGSLRYAPVAQNDSSCNTVSDLR
jgi:hypothetical protein